MKTQQKVPIRPTVEPDALTRDASRNLTEKLRQSVAESRKLLRKYPYWFM